MSSALVGPAEKTRVLRKEPKSRKGVQCSARSRREASCSSGVLPWGVGLGMLRRVLRSSLEEGRGIKGWCSVGLGGFSPKVISP